VLIRTPLIRVSSVRRNALDASGAVDDGEVLQVNRSNLPSLLGTATVTIDY
jgi:hypothetical protein